MLGFIDDGQTITRFVAGRKRLHYGVRITFRPIPSIDHGAVEKKVRKLNQQDRPEAAERLVYETIADRIIEWEFVDENDEIVENAPPANVESVMRLVPVLQDRLVMMVYAQNDGGDPDPADKKADTTSAKVASGEQLGNSTEHLEY